MKTTKIEVDLMSQKSIRNAQKELRKYKQALRNKVVQFGYRIAEQMSIEAKVWIQALDAVDTGNLLNSITISGKRRWVNHNAIFFVIADSEYACFVEFGTGMKGENSPYMFRLPDGVSWEYGVGSTIRQTKNGYGWLYPADDGTWRWTYGQPSRPFMANAFRDTVAQVELLAQEVFKY